MSILVVFLVMAISLSSWSNHADAATRDADELPAGVILEAGQIDSNTVEAGASVAVVYGLGYRDPVSGEWPRLTTARGTVHAVDGQRLLLALEGRDSQQRIDLERIQTLVLAGPPSLGPTDRDRRVRSGTVVEPAPRRRSEEGTAMDHKRIVQKLAAGAFLGGISVWSVDKALLGRCEGSTFCGATMLALGGLLVYPAGVAAGVSLVDPYDCFRSTALGSMVGLSIGLLTLPDDLIVGDFTTLLPFMAGPIIGATLMSEWKRKSPETHRFSLGLARDRRWRLSFLLTLRF